MELEKSLKTMRPLAPWSAIKKTHLQDIMQSVDDSDLVDAVACLQDEYFPEISVAEAATAKDLAAAAFSEMHGSTYHRPRHAFDVTLAVCELMDDLTPETAHLLFLVAIGHDIGHDGRADLHGDFALEAYAAERIAWLLSRHGYSDDAIGRSRLLTLATNAKYRRKIAHLADMDELSISGNQVGKLSMPVPLRPLAEDRSLWSPCAVLADADLFRSTSIGIDASKEQSVAVFSEMDNAPVTADRGTFTARRKGFLQAVAGEAHASRSGHAFRDALHSIWFEAFVQRNPLLETMQTRLEGLQGEHVDPKLVERAPEMGGVMANGDGHFIATGGGSRVTVSRSGLVALNGSLVSVVSGARE